MKRIISTIFYRKSEFKGVVCVFTCLFLLSNVGCAVTTVDRLPSSVPKGYVKFYNIEKKQTNAPSIYCIEVNKEVYEGQVPWPTHIFKTKEYCALQIAKVPGIYTYSVRLGTAQKDILVRVHQGMVTPVRISFANVVDKYTDGGWIRTTYFTMYVHVEEPIPFTK